MSEVDKSRLNEAILLLGKAWNNPSTKDIEKAIVALKQSTASASQPLFLIRADKVKEEDRKNFLTTGLKWFDQWIGGGMRLQEFIMFAAVPHGGKTHLLCWFAGQYILGGYTVLYIPLEDLMCDIKYSVAQVVQNKTAMKNFWLCSGVDTVAEVEEAVDELQRKGVDPDIIVVDNIDATSGSGKNDVEMLTHACRDIKLLAVRKNKVFASASQMNYGREHHGAARLHGAKVGKVKNLDLLLMVDDVFEDEMEISIEKARGRRIEEDDLHKTLLIDWSKMQIREA